MEVDSYRFLLAKSDYRPLQLKEGLHRWAYFVLPRPQELDSRKWVDNPLVLSVGKRFAIRWLDREYTSIW